MSEKPKEIYSLKNLSLRTQFSEVQAICNQSLQLPLLPRRELFLLPLIEMLLQQADEDTLESGIWLLCDSIRKHPDDLNFILEASLNNDDIAQLAIGILSRCICIMLKEINEHDEEVDEYTCFLSSETQSTIRVLSGSSNVGVKLTAFALLLRAQNRDELEYIQLNGIPKLTPEDLAQVRDPFMRKAIITLFPPNPQLLPSAITIGHPDPFYSYRALKTMFAAGECADSILLEALQSEVTEVVRQGILGFGAMRKQARVALHRRPDFANAIAHWMSSDHEVLRHAAIFAAHQLEDSLLDASPLISHAYVQAVLDGAISARPAYMFLHEHSEHFTRNGIAVGPLIQSLMDDEENEARSQSL